MDKKYLVYITVLAAWLCFCYWLYAKELFPKFHMAKGNSWPVFDEDLDFPLAFTWGSDIPLGGKGFEDWMENVNKVKSPDNIIIMKGYYFRDEAKSIEKGIRLGKMRAERMVRYLDLPGENTLIEVIPQEIKSDVRSHPFEAIEYETIRMEDIVKTTEDTIEICFPFKDSIRLALIEWKHLEDWMKTNSGKRGDSLRIIGTADGTGISESSDIAWERALVIKNFILQNGWNEFELQMSTGQRNHTEAVRNRCVIVYFE